MMEVLQALEGHEPAVLLRDARNIPGLVSQNLESVAYLEELNSSGERTPSRINIVMPSPNYLQRVRTALGNLAKNDLKTILFAELVDHVKDSLILEGGRAGPRADCFVRKALYRERLASRVKLIRGGDDDVKIVLSPYGFQYFQNLGTLQVIDFHGKKFQRLSTNELQKETQSLRNILAELLAVVRASHYGDNAVSAIEDLPGVVARIVARVKTLGEEIKMSAKADHCESTIFAELRVEGEMGSASSLVRAYTSEPCLDNTPLCEIEPS
ncbi:hypothetical protein FKP32DRAFT_1599782 [Trametes sanguinea]|nr:hypothetical protein FKP32DRAFT_1599782 [Trametes sanguinea]